MFGLQRQTVRELLDVNLLRQCLLSFLCTLAVLAPSYLIAGFQAGNSDGQFDYSEGRPRTTYERLLPLAAAGDPDVQNMLGFMHFYGEGVRRNVEEAHYWFHEAAEQGSLLAQRNLGLFHSRAQSTIPEAYYDPIEANFWFSMHAAGKPGESKLASDSYRAFLDPVDASDAWSPSDGDLGKEIYVGSCAGCHGFDGRAAYPKAPSLLAGESLDKSDESLLTSILDGRNEMPAWAGTLSEDQARAVLSYVRRRFEEWGVRPTAGLAEQAAAIDDPLSESTGSGEYVYSRFCAGCHGFNGISYYVNSPSFALRERMDKSDGELFYSISNGRGIMPGWERILTADQIQSLIRFVRTLADSYESGIDHELRVSPDMYFLFQPIGEEDDEWHVRGEPK